jgi:hypothetical protein
MVGRLSLLRIPEDDKAIEPADYAALEGPKRYFKSRLGGLGQYYFGPLRDLQILDYTLQAIFAAVLGAIECDRSGRLENAAAAGDICAALLASSTRFRRRRVELKLTYGNPPNHPSGTCVSNPNECSVRDNLRSTVVSRSSFTLKNEILASRTCSRNSVDHLLESDACLVVVAVFKTVAPTQRVGG